jgi:hypothetical protein
MNTRPAGTKSVANLDPIPGTPDRSMISGMLNLGGTFRVCPELEYIALAD